MSKEIKDYLHLYVGVECAADGERFKLTGAQYLPQGTSAYTEEVVDGIPQAWWVENCDFKLLLRPLSDMTEEEAEHIEGAFISFFSVANVEAIFQYHSPELCRYLLSRHFDLFGLIESGLAIDKTKTP